MFQIPTTTHEWKKVGGIFLTQKFHFFPRQILIGKWNCKLTKWPHTISATGMNFIAKLLMFEIPTTAQERKKGEGIFWLKSFNFSPSKFLLVGEIASWPNDLIPYERQVWISLQSCWCLRFQQLRKREKREREFFDSKASIFPPGKFLA